MFWYVLSVTRVIYVINYNLYLIKNTKCIFLINEMYSCTTPFKGVGYNVIQAVGFEINTELIYLEINYNKLLLCIFFMFTYNLYRIILRI